MSAMQEKRTRRRLVRRTKVLILGLPLLLHLRTLHLRGRGVGEETDDVSEITCHHSSLTRSRFQLDVLPEHDAINETDRITIIPTAE